MNEMLFFLHVALVLTFTYGAARLGQVALTAHIAVLAIIANLLVLKQMQLFGITVTCADSYVVGAMLTLNLIQVRYGMSAARQASWIAFFAMILVGVMGPFHLLYRPAPVDTAQGAYSQILSAAPRLALASLVSYLAASRINLKLFALLKSLPLPWRSGLALATCQACDTAIFCTLGLYGLVSSLGQIFLMSFAIKTIAIGCMAPLTTLLLKGVPAHASGE